MAPGYGPEDSPGRMAPGYGPEEDSPGRMALRMVQGGWPQGRRPRGGRSHLCLALMCICKPFRLDARCPHSSHTNSFSPRCLNASCNCSSVRDRKHLAQVGH